MGRRKRQSEGETDAEEAIHCEEFSPLNADDTANSPPSEPSNVDEDKYGKMGEMVCMSPPLRGI